MQLCTVSSSWYTRLISSLYSTGWVYLHQGHTFC